MQTDDIENFDYIKSTAVIESSQGEFGLWELIKDVEIYNEDFSDDTVKDAVLLIIKNLLENDLIRAGNFDEADEFFETWKGKPEEVLEIIKHKWEALGHNPDFEDNFVWFVATSKGDQYAAEHKDMLD